MRSMQRTPVSDTSLFKAVVEGCVLGDATLRRTSASAFFRMTQCRERTDLLLVVGNVLLEHGVLVKWDPYVDGRFDIRTPTHQYWKAVRERFYPNGVKVISNDYEPTQISLLFLYMCDGHYFPKGNYSKYYGSASGVSDNSEWCYIATYNFTWEDVGHLKMGIESVVKCESVICPQRQNDHVYPRLVFRGEECKLFLQYIYTHSYVPNSMRCKFPGKVAVM